MMKTKQQLQLDLEILRNMYNQYPGLITQTQWIAARDKLKNKIEEL